MTSTAVETLVRSTFTDLELTRTTSINGDRLSGWLTGVLKHRARVFRLQWSLSGQRAMFKKAVAARSYPAADIKEIELTDWAQLERLIREQYNLLQEGTPQSASRRSSYAEMLERAGLSELEWYALVVLCDGPATAEGMAAQLGLRHFVGANRLVGIVGRKLLEVAPARSAVRRWFAEGRKDRRYHVVTLAGKAEGERRFVYSIRPPWRDAMIELGRIQPPERVATPTTPPTFFEARQEGADVRRLVTIRERDPRLREACLAHFGYRCQICSIDLGERYGALGKNLIHVHHLVPLASLDGARETDPITDLIAVCPNCHAVIHRGGRHLSPAEVRAALRSQSSG